MAREPATDEVDGRGVGIDITDILVAADGGVVLRQHRAGVGVFLGLPLDAAGLAELRQRLLDAAVEAGDSGEEGENGSGTVICGEKRSRISLNGSSKVHVYYRE